MVRANFESCTKTKGIRSVDWNTERPLGVGSQFAFIARFLGRTLAYTYEVVELEPDRKMTIGTADGPFPMETTYGWQPLDDSSMHMTLRNRGAPRGFSRLVTPLMGLAIKRANMKDLDRLKRQLESPASTGQA